MGKAADLIEQMHVRWAGVCSTRLIWACVAAQRFCGGVTGGMYALVQAMAKREL